MKDLTLHEISTKTKSFSLSTRPHFTAFFITIVIVMSGSATTADAAAAAGDAYAASSTSCYTTEEKKDSYSTLSEILESKCADKLVRHVILDMMGVCADITEALRVNLVTVEGSSNVFGDSQLSVDVRKTGYKQRGTSACYV